MGRHKGKKHVKTEYNNKGEKQFEGVFSSHSKGFGFVNIPELDKDVFIPKGLTGYAFPGDKVAVVIIKPEKGDKSAEGKIVKILEHGLTKVVGSFEMGKGFGFVVPDNGKIGQDIFIPWEKKNGAKNKDKVVCEITSYGGKGRSAEGKVIEIIGGIKQPGVDITSIVKAYDINDEFPDEVIALANAVDQKVSEIGPERTDYRDKYTVTIDGEDAKDLDDAISIEKTRKGYRLGVHIADVSEYVTEYSPLDKEARKRGTSVYLPDRVIPMLPRQLSNGICSLNMGEDRLALSCIIDTDKEGNVLGHEIKETVINVNRRLSYTSVGYMLTHLRTSGRRVKKDELINAPGSEDYADYFHDKKLCDMVLLMAQLAGVLYSKREERGAINFDFKESKVILNELGKVTEVKPYIKTEANGIIEEFMLLANECVASEYFYKELPFVYRNHDNPDKEKMAEFAEFVNNVWHYKQISIKSNNKDEIHSKQLQSLLSKVHGTSEETVISMLMLRSMKRAQYNPVCTGHFGLASKCYCHFTSPIRRYPDLQIHRIIKENIRGYLGEARIKHYDAILPEVTEDCSKLERRADDAEREAILVKKIDYIKQFFGVQFNGIVTGLTEWGIYVTLDNTIEGMIRLADILGDYYRFDKQRMEIYGERGGGLFRLGQRIDVVPVAADKKLKTIDFAIVME